MTFTKLRPQRRQRMPANETAPAVLYIEDEDVNWEITWKHLRDRYDITRARDAREAFAAMAARRFDILLVDIQLSGSDLSGIDIVRVLRDKFGRAIPDFARGITAQDSAIVFVTAYSARYSRADLLDAGGDEMLTKPVNLTNLSLVMTRLLMQNLREQ